MLDRLVRRALASSLIATVALIAAPNDASAGSCIPGFDYGAFSKQCTMTFSGGAVTDSYNSALGTYVATKTNTGGNIGTNGTTAKCVKLSGSTTDINGNIDVGPGGGSSTVDTTGGATFDGAPNPNVLSSPLSMPSVTIPTVGTNQGDQTNPGALAPNQTYHDVKITGGSTLTLSSGEYVMNSLSLSGNSFINLNITTGPVVVYIVSDLDLSGGTVTNSTNISTNLLFLAGPSCSNVKLTGGSQAAYALYAPDSDVTISGGGEIFGAVVGKTVTDTGGSQIHYDKALQSATTGQFSCVLAEVSRSSPIAAIVQGSAATSIVQGTFESPTTGVVAFATVAQLTTWSFPFIKGHLRARIASTISTDSFTSGTILFDAGSTTGTPPGGIPASAATCSTPNASTCRYIFTNTNTANANGFTYLPTVKTFDDGNASTIGKLITDGAGLAGASPAFGATQWSTIISRIRAAKLGGVDRSTVAVIEPGNLVGTTRDRIAYFGATDGMLHAVCASTGTTCPAGSLGKELWAFMPRVQLPLVANNSTRVDGSVRVIDVYGDFPTAVAGSPATAPTAASGKRNFKTILLFQTGFGIGTAAFAVVDAAYAIDITNPALPVLLWEYTTPTSPGSVDFGTGMAAAAGPVVINGTTKNLAVFQTNNGGSTKTTANGFTATAIEIDAKVTGQKPIWQFTHAYPSPPRGVAADVMPLPPQSAPGGAVPVDINNTGEGIVTHFVMGDLYGSLWRLDAATGSPPTGTVASPVGPFTCGVADTAGVITTLSGTCSPIFTFSSSANKHPIGSLPAIFARTAGGAQYVGFASGGYVDPVATLWTTTAQKLIAVKVKPTTIPVNEGVATSITGDLLISAGFAASAEKSFAAAQIVGSKLLITTDSADVNLSSYGTGASSGNIYQVDIAGAATSGTMTVLATAKTGAGSIANDAAGGRAYFSAGKTTTSSTAGGVSVDASQGVRVTRRLWLRSQKS